MMRAYWLEPHNSKSMPRQCVPKQQTLVNATRGVPLVKAVHRGVARRPLGQCVVALFALVPEVSQMPLQTTINSDEMSTGHAAVYHFPTKRVV